MMKTICIDGKLMKDRDILHRHLKNCLNRQDYYGSNLDALWDVLSTYSEPLKINLINIDYLNYNLGSYSQQLITLVEDAVESNSNISLIMNIYKEEIQ